MVNGKYFKVAIAILVEDQSVTLKCSSPSIQIKAYYYGYAHSNYLGMLSAAKQNNWKGFFFYKSKQIKR